MSLKIQRLTSPGRGAVAVLRVECSNSSESGIDLHFQPVGRTPAAEAATGRILYGHWKDEDVVVVRTDPTTWEIHCHGGEAAVSRIMDDLNAAAVPESGNDFDLDTRLLKELLRCRTRKTLQYLLAQRHSLQREFLEQLLQITDTDELVLKCREFLKHRSFAEHLTEPWTVVVAGQPNAGKSSLLNAIVGFERSIVFDEPGTTRDRIEAETTINGWPFRFQDTAGIREQTLDTIEAAGIQTAKASIAACDALLLVVDSVSGWSPTDQQVLDAVPATTPTAVVWNKTDLPRQKLPPDGIRVIPTCATESGGVPHVMDWLTSELVGEPPPIDLPLPVVREISEKLSAFCEDKARLPLAAALNEWLL